MRFLRHARYLYAQAIREVNSRDYRDSVKISEPANADFIPDDTTAQDNAENYPDYVPDDLKYDEQADFEGGFDYEAGREYSITQTVDGRSVAVVDNDILADIDLSKWDRETKELVRKTASQELKKFGNDIYANGNHYKLNKKIRDEYTRSNDADKLYRINKEAFYDKMRTADVLDDVIASTEFGETDGQLTHNRNDNLVDFMHGKVLIQAGNNKYEASTIIGITDKNEFRFHDIEDIRPVTFKLKEESSSAVSELSPINAMPEDSSFGVTIPQDSGNVNKQFSISQRNSDSVISRLLNEADQKDVAREERGLSNWMNNRLGLGTADDRSLGRYWAKSLAEGYFSADGNPDEARIREAFNDIMNNLQGAESENYTAYGSDVLKELRTTKIYVPTAI